jgi:polysaccharide pyruvyl transferase WcaK-like protein
MSLEFCRRHGLPAVLEPDDAFDLIAGWSATTPRTPGPGPRKIGVCIFPQYGMDEGVDLTDWWTQCLRGLKRQHPEHAFEGFCFHASPREEFREMVRLFSRAELPVRQVLAPRLDFREATDGTREYDFILSTRFHAVVAANAFNIPNLAMAAGDYYLAKMQAAVRGHEHLSTLVNPVRTSPEDVLAICRRELAQRMGGH